MAITPLEPGGSASSILSPMPEATRFPASLPITAPAAAPTAVAASRGGAKRPSTRPTPPPSLAPLRPRWSPVSSTCTSPWASLVTRITPSLVTEPSSTNATSASKSCWASSGTRYTAIRTSSVSSLISHLLCAGGVGSERLRRVFVKRLRVVLAQVRGDVEHDLLDLAGEAERRLVGIAQVDDVAVVAADVHPGVEGEPRRDRVLHAAARHLGSVDEQRDLSPSRGLWFVSGEHQLDADVSGRKP